MVIELSFQPYRFVLVKFRQDTIVQPIETEWFQFYTPNQDKVIQPLAESAVAVSSLMAYNLYMMLMMTTKNCIKTCLRLIEQFGID